MENRNLFLNFLNDNIGRMNANSMNCKTLMAALNAGLLAAGATSSKYEILWIAIGITILLYFLDCYYLMLEKNFRCLESNLLEEEKESDDISGLLFNFNAKEILGFKKEWKNFAKSLYSPSTLGIYIPIVVAIIITLCILSSACICACSK